ncbi:MAG: hypothetical protein MZV70_52090 [Desulfobacterales bacterium]|nr:hypothetical protein [Desulfobacterales bacterium]
MAVPVGLIASTAATQKALGEMASLGTKDLRALEDAAESFTNTWAGYSKAEFIGAAYDVKSALAEPERRSRGHLLRHGRAHRQGHQGQHPGDGRHLHHRVRHLQADHGRT